MTTRTTETKVTFKRPFVVDDAKRPYPPGEYLIATDEELIDQLSFPVWRRVTTMIHVRRDGATQVLTIDPAKLESLLATDAETTAAG
jgi:hypothetical protein